jgi:GT2 family glycosyltransferase
VRDTPLVSYILVNWRTSDTLPRALESLAAQTHQRREVIVVDNGSEDFHAGLLAQMPQVRLIENSRNLGFAVANNQALSVCRGEFIVLLNCDAYIEPEFTRYALDVFAENERIGTVVPKILRDDGSGEIDSAGHVMYTDRTAAHRGRGELDQGQYDAGGFVFGGTAAAIAYRRAMLATVALPPQSAPEDDADGFDASPALGPVFDAAFFAYFEDVDLDWRANLCGWLAYYAPECVAYHRGHGSGGRRSMAIRLRAEKNRYLMLAKNDTLAGQLSALGPLLVYETWHALKLALQPWLWPSLLMLWWRLPGAWAYRLYAGPRRSVRAGAVAAQFARRGMQPPPMPAPPSMSAVPLLERPGERRSADYAASFPLVSVVIVNYNGLELTRACLQALNKQTYEPLEIIVVDNGSATDEADLLAMSFPQLKTLGLHRNHGFAGGVNWGLTLATGEYIVLLNNDCLPEPDCIRRLVYAARRTGAPAVSGRLIDLASPQFVPAALTALELEQERDEEIVWDMPLELAQALEESWRNHGLSLSGFIIHDAYGDKPECFYPSGGLCLLARTAVGAMLPRLFPHAYFAYHEDVNLGLRLRAQGGWVAKEPRAAAVHVHGSTARRLGRPRLRFLQERNRWLNLLGYLPAGVIAKLAPLWLMLWLVACVTLLIRPGDWLGWAMAQLWLATHVPTVLRWRAQCRAAVSVPDAQWQSAMSGRLRGHGGLLNSLSLAWCRLLRLPCLENSHHTPDSPDA